MGFLQKEVKGENKKMSLPNLHQRILENKYQVDCVKHCFENFSLSLSEKELFCLAECNEGYKELLLNKGSKIVQLKSQV